MNDLQNTRVHTAPPAACSRNGVCVSLVREERWGREWGREGERLQSSNVKSPRAAEVVHAESARLARSIEPLWRRWPLPAACLSLAQLLCLTGKVWDSNFSSILHGSTSRESEKGWLTSVRWLMNGELSPARAEFTQIKVALVSCFFLSSFISVNHRRQARTNNCWSFSHPELWK